MDTNGATVGGVHFNGKWRGWALPSKETAKTELCQLLDVVDRNQIKPIAP